MLRNQDQTSTPCDGVPVVVVVDGRSSRRHRLSAVVGRAGARVVEASTPLEVLVALDGDAPVDAVVVGKQLTQTTPAELAAYVRAEHPDVGVTAISRDDPTSKIEVRITSETGPVRTR
jgi:PleD family two-component response regulator